MVYILASSLHTEELLMPAINQDFAAQHQVVAVMTGGSEQIFLEKVRQGEISLSEPIYLLAGPQSNSLAACCEILSWINQHGGTGKLQY